MGLEIGRRLIDGIWRTGSADEDGGGGSQPVPHGCMYTLDSDFVRAAGSRTINWDTRIYDTDDYLPVIDNVNTFPGRLTVPAGLGGIYLMEAVIYVLDVDGAVNRPNCFFTDPSNSCLFKPDRRMMDDSYVNGVNLSGAGSCVRPLQEGDDVSVSVNFGSSPISVLSGLQASTITLTKLYDLPDDYVSPF